MDVREIYRTYDAIYSTMRLSFREYVYRHYKNWLERTSNNNLLIDQAIRYRMGLSPYKPVSNNKTVSEVLEDLIYGNAVSNNLIETFKGQCIAAGVPSRCIVDNLRNNYEERYKFLHNNIDRDFMKYLRENNKPSVRDG